MLIITLAITINIIVVIFSALIKVGKSEQPSSHISRVHLYFTSLFLIGSGVIYFIDDNNSFAIRTGEFIIGLFTYFGVYYGFIFLIFALAHRSVTIAIISKIIQSGGSISLKELLKTYNGEEGFQRVMHDRLTNSIRFGLITVQRKSYIRTTTFGWFLGMLSIFILKTLNLKRVSERND